MRANVLACKPRIFATIICTMAAMLIMGFFPLQASAVDDASIQARAVKNEAPSGEWSSITIQAGNTNPSQDFAVLEAGIKSLPEGLEKRGELKTEYSGTGKLIPGGTDEYIDVYKIEVRTSNASPSPSNNTVAPTQNSTRAAAAASARTGDSVHLATLVAIAIAAAAIASFAFMRMRVSASEAAIRRCAHAAPSNMRSLRGMSARVVTLVALLAAMFAAGLVLAQGAQSAEADTVTKTAECTSTVTIDGKDYRFDCYVVYVAAQADPKPDPQPTPTPKPDPEPDPDPETVEIAVEKTWDDGIFFDGAGNPLGSYERPSSVSVVLTAEQPSGPNDPVIEVGKTEIAPDENGNWNGTITVPKHNQDGSEIDYSSYYLMESPVPAGFSCDPVQPQKQQDGSYAAAMQNSVESFEQYAPAPFALYAVNKNTVEGNNISQAVRMGSAEFALTNASDPADVTTLTTDADGKAAHSFSALGTFALAETSAPAPYAKDDGILDIVVEKGDFEDLVFDASKGMWALTYGLTYSFDKSGTGTELAHLFPKDVPEAELGRSVAVLGDVQQEYLTLTVNKVWEDNNDFYGSRPQEFTLVVRKELNAGVLQVVGSVAVASSSEGSQTCSFDQVQNTAGDPVAFERYKLDGSEWCYNISESIVGYSKPYVFTYKKSDGSSSWMGVDSGGTITAWVADNQTFAKAWNDRKYFTGEAAALGDANEYRRPKGIEYDLVGTADGKEVWKEEQLFIDSGSSYGDYTWMKGTLAPKFSGSSAIEYRVVENVPAGYVISDANGTVVTNKPVEEDKVEPLVLTIKKVDESTGVPLAGAVFAARPSGNSTAAIETAPTDANGETTLTFHTADFARTDWEIVEQQAPEGWVLNKTVYNVVLDKTLTSIKPVELEDQGNTQTIWQWGYSSAFGQGTHADIKGNAQDGYTLTVKNTMVAQFREEFSSELTVYAVDEVTVPSVASREITNGTMLEGAKFTLTPVGMPGVDPITLTTGADGKAVGKFEATGTYTFVQTYAPTGYVKAEGSSRIITTKGNLVSRTFDSQKGEWVYTYKLNFAFVTPEQGALINSLIPTDVPELGTSIAVLNASVTTSKTVTKTWIDGSNSFETRPSEIDLVVKDGEAFEKSVTLSGSGDSWSETVTDLPQYRGKSEIAYTVDESEVPLAPAPDWTGGDRSLWEDFYRYDSQVDGLNVTNTLMMAVNGQVTWEALTNAASGQRDERIPVQVDIVLQRLNGDDPDDETAWTDVDSTTVQTGQQTQTDPSNGYNVYNFGYIPVFDASGNAITYRVVAPDCPPEWECVGGVDNLICRPASIMLTLEKTWDDEGNTAQRRPTLYGDLLDAVGLYADGVPIENTPYKDSCYRWMDGDKSKGDTWVAYFSVPKYAADLKTELVWDIKEVGTFEGYTNGEVVKGDDGVFRVTNTYTGGTTNGSNSNSTSPPLTT